MTTNPTNNPPQKVKKKPQPKPHYSPSPFRRGEKKSSGTCKGAGQGCVWDFYFFPCLENLPDYFLTFPERSAQEPGWTWGSIFSSLLCLPSQSHPPRPQKCIFLASFCTDQKYLSLLEVLAWPFLNFSSIQEESRPPVLGTVEKADPRRGDEVPNPFPTARQHSLGFHHPLQNQKSRIFASQMIWERAGTARSGSGAPAPCSPRVSRAPRGAPGVFFPESTLKSRPGGGCASLGSGAFGRGARPRLKLRC